MPSCLSRRFTHVGDGPTFTPSTTRPAYFSQRLSTIFTLAFAFASPPDSRTRTDAFGRHETVAVRATYTEALAPREVRVHAPEPAPEDTRHVEAHSFALNRRLPFAIVPRTTIGGLVNGPCIVTETTSTLYVDAGWAICPGAQGELILDRTEI